VRVAVVGGGLGGLGGLAAALFLRRAGIDATVYEQSAELRELGAGIVVSPNMVRPFERLGLGAALERIAVRLEAGWEFRRWQDGRVLFVQPMGEECLRLYGAHCYVAHRADLLQLLRDVLPEGFLQLQHRCVDVGLDGEVRFESKTMKADVVIGADGIHSVVLEKIAPKIEARFSGLCAFRCLVPAERAPQMALRPVQTLWLDPGHHFVHYPISAGRLVNVVGIGPAGDWRTESWTAEGKIEDMQREFAGWDARVHQLIASATDTRRWALYDRAPLERWTVGRIALLGDAAHAMLPFFGQGAAQAIEDAETLAACLRETSAGSAEQALARYEQTRRPRANEVLLMSRGREIRNHLPDGPAKVERDAELARGDPLRASAWLYGHAHESAQ
jgi:salicylate hydroxylase